MRRTSWLIGAVPALGTLVILVAVGPHIFYGHSDADLFLAVARSPLGNGRHFPGNHLVQGVAYRYGRILFPSLGWVLGFGRRPWITWSLAVVFAASVGAWIAATAEHLARRGRDPRLALLVLVMPFSVVWIRLPIVVGEPLAGALVLFTYLYAEDRKQGRTIVAAALTILTREVLAIAFVPLIWRAYKERGAAGLLQWSFALVPYSIWSLWVRLRVGHFPFLDPAATRRDALALPFVGWDNVLHQPTSHGPGLGLLVGGATIVVAVLVAVRNRGRSLIVQAALISCGFIACYGWAVWQYPTEAVRVMAPAQVLLLIAALTTGAPRAAVDLDVSAPRREPAPISH
jgi:hypothetical protein